MTPKELADKLDAGAIAKECAIALRGARPKVLKRTKHFTDYELPEDMRARTIREVLEKHLQ